MSKFNLRNKTLLRYVINKDIITSISKLGSALGIKHVYQIYSINSITRIETRVLEKISNFLSKYYNTLFKVERSFKINNENKYAL